MFGDLCYSSTLSAHRGKFDARAKECAFLGFKSRTKDYLMLDFTSRTILPFRNATFYDFSYLSGSVEL